jgi:hypothetical protein
MSNNDKKTAEPEVKSNSLLEQTSIELWEICTQTNIDTFNDEIFGDEVQRRVDKFTKVLADFQRKSFPTNKL